MLQVERGNGLFWCWMGENQGRCFMYYSKLIPYSLISDGPGVERSYSTRNEETGDYGVGWEKIRVDALYSHVPNECTRRCPAFLYENNSLPLLQKLKILLLNLVGAKYAKELLFEFRPTTACGLYKCLISPAWRGYHVTSGVHISIAMASVNSRWRV